MCLVQHSPSLTNMDGGKVALATAMLTPLGETVIQVTIAIWMVGKIA